MNAGSALPAGHALRHFRIDGLIGQGGFGIVYRATDLRLQRPVAIKEYMPAALAQRGPDGTVELRAPDCDARYARGLRGFVEEARTLAGLDLPGAALVEVHDFWEEHGTAYMVMRCYEGPTLKDWLRERSAPDEATLRALAAPLLDVLERLHGADPPCVHRDIAPDNILLLGPTRPLLLDFGAARRVIADATQDLTVIFKPGFAPLEQYAESAALPQGPWTDVYALCAVLRYAITGQTPPQALHRISNDPLVPLAQCAAGRCSPGFLAAIDAGMRVQPQDRPRDMAALRALLLGAPAPRPAAGRRRVLGLAGALGTTLLAGLAWRFMPRPPAAAPDKVAAATPAPPASTPPALPPPPPPPFGMAAVFDTLQAGADPARRVALSLPRERLRIGRDALRYRIDSAADGFVYTLLHGSDGTLHLLFPEAIDRDNRIRAGQPLTLPRRGAPLTALGPAGTDRLLVIVSAVPREPAALMRAAPEDGFPAFDLAALEQAWRVRGTAAAKELLGVPRCPTTGACEPGYGAASATLIEEE